jgi:hypothetical protein
MTPAQIARTAHDAGFRGHNLVIAVAVALAESGGRPDAHNNVAPDNSYGLWQINMLGGLGPERRAQFHLHDNGQLLTPSVNARAAWAISSHGTNWHPWSTYTNGAYTGHLDAARHAVDALGSGRTHPVTPTRPAHVRVVLDLAELTRLAQLFEHAAHRVAHTRLALGRLAADLEPARARLADPAVATLIADLFATLAAPTQLALAQDRLDRQGTYAQRVRDLADSADGADNRWSPAEKRAFRHGIGPTLDPYERAVREALVHGRITRGRHVLASIGPAGGATGHRTPGHKHPEPAHNGHLPASALHSIGDGEKLASAPAAHFRAMDARAGTVGLNLHANSGYRTEAEQAVLYDRYRHGQGALAAPPGHSTHGLGLSVDIDVRNPAVLTWLRRHAAGFGFVNDVPSEPWHWTWKG